MRQQTTAFLLFISSIQQFSAANAYISFIPIPTVKVPHAYPTVFGCPNRFQCRGEFPPLKMSETAEQMSIESVSEKLVEVKSGFDKRMADATTLAEAEAIRREYMGKKGPLNDAMGYMRLLSNEDKPRLGVVINEIKASLEDVVSQRLEELQRAEIEARMEQEKIDVTDRKSVV